MLMHYVVVVVWKLHEHAWGVEERMSYRHFYIRTILFFVAAMLLDEILVLVAHWVPHVYHTPVRNVAS